MMDIDGSGYADRNTAWKRRIRQHGKVEVYMDIKTEYDKMAQLILEADDAVAIIPLLNRDEWDVYSAIVKLYEAGHNVVTDGLEIPTRVLLCK